MNIQTVALNLRNTISGKEKLLESWKTRTEEEWLQAGVSYSSMRQMVEINIDELKRILQDVEQCRPEWSPFNCPYAAAETCHRVD